MSERKETVAPTAEPTTAGPTDEWPTRVVAATRSSRDRGIIDSPAALAYDPMLVKRLKRLKRLKRMRETRTSARTLMPHPSADNSSPS